MKSDMGIAEPVVHYKDESDCLDEEVTRALKRFFETILSPWRISGTAPKVEPMVDDPQKAATKLANAIFRFSRAAAAGAPDATVLSGFHNRLLNFVQSGIPVEAQMLWSPKKHWMLGTESGADLAELFAFQTLVSIRSAVQSVYRPGMSFVIDLEDLEFEFMEGESKEVVNSQNTYISGMKRLLKALALDEFFTVRRISERAKSAEELRQWRQQMAENYRALQAYWSESEACPVSLWETLESFSEIRRLGWKGTIPPEMRSYYLKFGKLVDAPDAERVDMVVRNLATILLHYQFDLLRGSGGVQPLKFSFVRAADGAPAKLLDGRVDFRFAPRKLCSRVSAAAPWATKGFLHRRGNDVRVSFRGWRELTAARCRFREGWLTIAGHDGDARVRADFAREDEE
jgi:hypothetical protein